MSKRSMKMLYEVMAVHGFVAVACRLLADLFAYGSTGWTVFVALAFLSFMVFSFATCIYVALVSSTRKSLLIATGWVCYTVFFLIW